MICLAGNLPALKVGPQEVVGYPTDWIERALARAAEAAGRGDCPFLDLISDGVIHYLEHHCPLRLCPLESLYERMGRMLRRIGCADIAEQLVPLAPPVTVSLVGPARRSGRKAPLTFFEILGEEIRLLHQSGAEVIRFCDLEESVSLLSRRAKRRKKLKDDLIAFFEGRHETSSFFSFPRSDLHLTLEP